MFLFDSHLHFFSHDFFCALAKQKSSPASIDQTLAELAESASIELPDQNVDSHLKRWLNELDRNNVDRAAIFASVPEEIQAVGEALKLASGRWTGFFMVNPTAEGSVHRVHKCCNHFGYRGVMLFPAMHHYHVYDESLEIFFEAASECRFNVFVHFGMLVVKLRDVLGLPRVYDSRFSNPLDLQSVSNRYRHLNFIIPHFGCGFFRETLMLGAQCDNVYVDTSSSNNWMATQPYPLSLDEVFRRIKNIFGAERILFGSDSGVFPRGWRKDILEAQLEAMEQAGFSSTEQELVLGKNAERLLGANS